MSIRCTGAAAGEFPADTATVRIRVAPRHALAERAHARRVEARDLALGVLAAAAGVQLRGESVSANTWDGETAAVWECEAVAVGEFAGLREVISRLAAVPGIEVSGPDWALSPGTALAAREHLLARAVRNARREAEILIEALGGHLGPVLAVRSGEDGYQPTLMRMTGVDAGSDDLPPRTLELDLTPEMIHVEESVTVEFGIA